MSQLIIKGAIYFDGDLLLRPHFTGKYYVVDCTEFKTKKQIEEEYSKETAEGFIEDGFVLTHKGIKYHECEYSPYNVSETWELLSDLSDLEHFDDETSF